MAEVLFYHLERQPLERVLPQLIGKALERGWRAVVQAASTERVEALSMALWTGADDSFLAHGTARDGNGALQPVWITAGDDCPNGARLRFLVDGAVAADLSGLDRAVYVFDGADSEAVERARALWKDAKSLGHDVTYWQLVGGSSWQKQA